MDVFVFVGGGMRTFNVYADDTNSELYDKAYCAVLDEMRDDATFRAELFSYDFMPTTSQERFTTDLNRYTRDLTDAFERDDFKAMGMLLARNVEEYISEIYGQLKAARQEM